MNDSFSTFLVVVPIRLDDDGKVGAIVGRKLVRN
jgi:hypothetical protein